MAAQAVPFALTPALVDLGVINYTTAEGKKLYSKATQSLYSSTVDYYDGKAEKLSAFLFKLKTRSQEYGWLEGGILEVDVGTVAAPVVVNMLDNYGEISLAQVQAHAGTYVAQQNRAAQDSMMLFQCIMQSLTTECLDNVRNKAAAYTINGIPSGTSLVWLLIQEARMDTNATIKRITGQIANLPEYMQRVKSDVAKFNLHVEDLVAQLAARGLTSNELLINLFQAYQMCEDEVFKRYIEAKENQYDDGLAMTETELMQVALTKYQTRVDGGEWQVLTAEQEKIVTLEARLKRQEQQRNKTGNQKNKLVKNQPKGQYLEQGRNKKPDWMLKHPSEQEKKAGKKVVDGKEYYWCESHKAWGRHKSEECKGLGFKPVIKTKSQIKPPTLMQQTAQISEEHQSDQESDDE